MKTLNLSILFAGSLTLLSNPVLALNDNAVDATPAHSGAKADSGPLTGTTEEITSLRDLLGIANAWLDETESRSTGNQAPEDIIARLGSDTTLITEWLSTEPPQESDYNDDEKAWQAALEARYTVLDHIVTELQQLAVEQPHLALDIAQNKTDNEDRQWFSAMVVASWATHDASAAMDWLNEQDQSQQDLHRHSVLYEVILDDPARALLEIDAIEDPDLKLYWHDNYAAQIAETDPGGALQWAETLDGESRYRARQAAFNRWYWTSPEAALRASDRLLADDERALFIESIAHDLPAFDLALAQSVFDNGNEEVRRGMAYSLVQSLYAQDATAAEAWVEQLVQPGVRTEAQISLVERFSQEQPGKVLSTLRQINAEFQLDIMESLVWDLSYSNRNLVESWLIDGSLSQGEQTIVEDILQRLDDGESPYGC